MLEGDAATKKQQTTKKVSCRLITNSFGLPLRNMSANIRVANTTSGSADTCIGIDISY